MEDDHVNAVCRDDKSQNEINILGIENNHTQEMDQNPSIVKDESKKTMIIKNDSMIENSWDTDPNVKAGMQSDPLMMKYPDSGTKGNLHSNRKEIRINENSEQGGWDLGNIEIDNNQINCNSVGKRDFTEDPSKHLMANDSWKHDEDECEVSNSFDR